MNIVDRPWPENHEYNSKKYILHFNWVDQASQTPISIRVEFENGENLKLSPSTMPWRTIEEARKDGIKQTEKYLDSKEQPA